MNPFMILFMTCVLISSMLLSGPTAVVSDVTHNEREIARPIGSARSSDTPVWTTWGANQYTLADDGSSSGSGAPGVSCSGTSNSVYTTAIRPWMAFRTRPFSPWRSMGPVTAGSAAMAVSAGWMRSNTGPTSGQPIADCTATWSLPSPSLATPST